MCGEYRLMVKALDCDSKNIGSSPIIYLMRLNFVWQIFKRLVLLCKKKKNFYKFRFFYIEWDLIPIDKTIHMSKYLFINKYFFFFYNAHWLKILLHKLKNIFKFTWNTYIFLLPIFIAYNYLKLDKMKIIIYNWRYYYVKLASFIFPYNSRYKFRYEKILQKTFMTFSAGMILKLFKLKKKSMKHHKKIFKLGVFFLSSNFLYYSGVILLLLFKTLHKNIFLYVPMVILSLRLHNKLHIIYFKFKKYNHFRLFKKKKSIKKRFKKRFLAIK